MRRRTTTSITTTFAALALLLGACGQGTPSPEVGAGLDEAGDTVEDETGDPVDLPVCPEWDAPRTYDPPPDEQPTPDAALTTANVNPDLPVEDGDDPFPGEEGRLFGEVRAWAEREAPEHFAGLWIDNEHGATVVAFTEDVDRYADEVRERFGQGWWVVTGEHTHADLDAAQQQVIARMNADGGGGGDSAAGLDDLGGDGLDDDLGGDGLGDEFDDGGTVGGEVGTPPGTVVGTGQREDIQRVTVTVVGGDDAALAELVEEFDHPAICFEVLDPPPTYEPDGPVRTLATVPGWRDDLDSTGDGALEIAYDRDTAERAFADNVPDDLPTDAGHVAEDGLHADLDSMDWDREVLVVWSGGRSSGCPVWVEDLRTDGGRVEVDSASPSQGACPADFNPYRGVLAVDRDRVPPQGDLPVPVAQQHANIEAVAYQADGS